MADLQIDDKQWAKLDKNKEKEKARKSKRASTHRERDRSKRKSIFRRTKSTKHVSKHEEANLTSTKATSPKAISPKEKNAPQKSERKRKPLTARGSGWSTQCCIMLIYFLVVFRRVRSGKKQEHLNSISRRGTIAVEENPQLAWRVGVALRESQKIAELEGFDPNRYKEMMKQKYKKQQEENKVILAKRKEEQAKKEDFTDALWNINYEDLVCLEH